MTNSLIFYLYFVPILVLILLGFNLLLAVNKRPDSEKMSPFECGMKNFSDTRSPFSVSYYLVGILFLVLDLELIICYPLVMALSQVTLMGYWVAFFFLVLLTVGFILELCSGVISVHSRFDYSYSASNKTIPPNRKGKIYYLALMSCLAKTVTLRILFLKGGQRGYKIRL